MLVRVNKGLLIAYERCGVERLSEVLGVTNQTIYNYRNGKRQLSLSDAGRLSIALRVAWLNFFQWEETPTVSMAKKRGGE